MKSPTLPAELTTLIQHVELQKAGWWQKTLGRLVIGAIYIEGSALNAQQIHSYVRDHFHAPASKDSIDEALKLLIESKELLEDSGSYRIPQQHIEHLETEIAEAEKLGDAVRERFDSSVKKCGDKIDGMLSWEKFEGRFLRPFLSQTGIDAYGLITGAAIPHDAKVIDDFLREYSEDDRLLVRAVIADFLDPKDDAVRHYVGMLLHAHFCVASSGISEDTIGRIERLTQESVEFSVFVDTNFLFSLLSLHDNPSNETAEELRQLIAAIGGRINARFYITPRTIKEAQSSVSTAKYSVMGVSPSSNINHAAIQADLSGMAAKFFVERSRTGKNLTPADYFGPYLKDFVGIARGRGVELFNEKLDAYATRQDVVDTITSIQWYQEHTAGVRQKRYEVIEHDAVLWHFVNDKRAALVESPLEAKYWILTVDYGFIRLDAAKQRKMHGQVPICIHPTSLISLLQFWIPRSKEFDEAMLGSLRLPFLFREFDVDAEKTSLRILQSLSRFAGIDDLPKESVTAVVLNDGLRSRINDASDEEVEFELVRDQLVEQVRGVANDRQRDLGQMEAAVADRDAQIRRIQEEKHQTDAEAERLRHRVEGLESQISRLNQRVAADREAAARNQLTRQYLAGLLATVLVAVGVGWWVASLFASQGDAARVFFGIGSSTIIFIAGHFCIEKTVKRASSELDSSIFRCVSRFRNWLWSVVVIGFIVGLLNSQFDELSKKEQTSDQAPAATNEEDAVSGADNTGGDEAKVGSADGERKENRTEQEAATDR